MRIIYQVRIEHNGYDSGWYDFEYASRVGDFISDVLTTFDNEATFTVRKIETEGADNE